MMDFELFMKVCNALKNTKNIEESLKKFPKAFDKLSKENNFEDMSRVIVALDIFTTSLKPIVDKYYSDDADVLSDEEFYNRLKELLKRMDQ